MIARNDIIAARLKKRERNSSDSIISRFKRDYKSAPIDVSDIDKAYEVVVNDQSIQNPFIISSGLVRIIRNHTKNLHKPETKARAIYDWVEENINYGMVQGKGYHNSEEVLVNGQGICGEMAYVYITMARCTGLRSGYVSVSVDNNGKDVNHACAAVDIGVKDILVDPAYHGFDIKHQKHEKRTDNQVLCMFNQWRNGRLIRL